MTDAELARIIELSQQAWVNGEPVGEDGLPVDPGLRIDPVQGSIVKMIPQYRTIAYRVGTDAEGETLASAPTWVRQLIAEIYALRGILGDVMRDGGIEQGRKAERREIRGYLDYCLSLTGPRDEQLRFAYEDVGKYLLQRGVVADPLPPEQSMREILRLREAIRKALAIIRPTMPHVVETELILREALGEDDE